MSGTPRRVRAAGLRMTKTERRNLRDSLEAAAIAVTMNGMGTKAEMRTVLNDLTRVVCEVLAALDGRPNALEGRPQTRSSHAWWRGGRTPP